MPFRLRLLPQARRHLPTTVQTLMPSALPLPGRRAVYAAPPSVATRAQPLLPCCRVAVAMRRSSLLLHLAVRARGARQMALQLLRWP
jgi:hypothetical protein